MQYRFSVEPLNDFNWDEIPPQQLYGRRALATSLIGAKRMACTWVGESALDGEWRAQADSLCLWRRRMLHGGFLVLQCQGCALAQIKLERAEYQRNLEKASYHATAIGSVYRDHDKTSQRRAAGLLSRPPVGGIRAGGG